jgi:hypothetical protein
MTFILAFAGGWLLGMGATRNDNRYVAAGFGLFGLALVLCFV